MYEVVANEQIAPDVFRMVVKAPRVAKKRQAGQFVLVRAEELGERIPLTIADADPEQGTITLIIQRVGYSTHQITSIKAGGALRDVVGPLGKPTHIERFGTVACVGGGIGIAPLYPIAQALKEAQNRIISILGARSKDLLILEDEMRALSEETIITTDDGSYGIKGFVTDGLRQVLEREQIDHAFVVGPVPMMKFCCAITKEYGIPTTVSLNPIMVDGTGMCGGCRVTVHGKVCFACVEGPEFDGHGVDFDELSKRLKQYTHKERAMMARLEGKGECVA